MNYLILKIIKNKFQIADSKNNFKHPLFEFIQKSNYFLYKFIVLLTINTAQKLQVYYKPEINFKHLVRKWFLEGEMGYLS